MISLWRRILPQRVANTGAQLRDHQANERTFLSWTRMGLGFAAMALALGRLDAVDHMISLALSSPKANLLAIPENAGARAAAARSGDNNNNSTEQPPNTISAYLGSDLSAATLCQAIIYAGDLGARFCNVWVFGGVWLVGLVDGAAEG
ncbi:hypothetical protein CNMCM5793_004283 [Aspergillus hiratsukae]|uniref:DUF202 domain-containing protein n=1 Tax=Aspergillus hiratsukae TaxID=1194566 RepID=A0A8H6QEX0_9EURO|nr:hypothetical protein CNMCM5793_004283 [Aspergillus hiratsukae]KAF7171002.1 hypothetical protein CNMCM6106_005522 [Aspergillus hiratsukae]